MKKISKTLRNAMRRFRQGRITFEKLNSIKLKCRIDDANRKIVEKSNHEELPEVVQSEEKLNE